MSVLAVPNWSFGRNRALLREFESVLHDDAIALHFLAGDADHNRTVTAFSGPIETVLNKIRLLCASAFDAIDLNRHVGVHPRIGALDVCPFVPLNGEPLSALVETVDRFAQELAELYELPVFLYEKSEKGRHEAMLPELRKGGFGGLLDKELNPDFGPQFAHKYLGATVMGVRGFLIAMNADLATTNLMTARRLASQMRRLRTDGDPRFLGVRSLGLPLASRDLTQVSMNLTLPDITSVDPIFEWIIQEASRDGVALTERELIGVIRDTDLPSATHLPIKPEQIVQGADRV